MCIAQVWRSDAGCCALGTSPLDTMHSAMDSKLSTLIYSRRSIKLYKTLTYILLKIRTLEHERPKDITSVAFPYSLAMVDNHDFIENALRYLKFTLVSKDHPRIIAMVDHLSNALVKAMLELSPENSICSTVLSLAQNSPALHTLIAQACSSNLIWLDLFTKASWLTTIRKLCPEWTSLERNKALFYLAQSTQGLVLCYEILLLYPLNLFELLQNPEYGMSATLQLLNIPAYASMLFQNPELKTIYMAKQKELAEHFYGLEAIYSLCEEAPYELRDAVDMVDKIELVMWTPFIAIQQDKISPWLNDLNDQHDVSLNLTLTIMQAWTTSSHFGSFYLSELSYQPWKCDCPINPCCIDPIACKMHRIQQSLLFVGGITEVPRPTTFELSSLCIQKPMGRPSTAMLGEFEAQFHHLLSEIDHSTSYLDFKRIGDHFWHLITEIDASPPPSAKLTIWMGDFFYNLLVCGKSKLDIPYPTTISIPEPVSIDQESKWPKFINTWLKNYNHQLGLESLPCSSLLPVVLKTLGEEACDPLVWSILLMLSQRHDQKQVSECLLRLRHSSFALFLWPQLILSHQLFHGCPAPMYVTASIVEWILNQKCPKIMIALRRLQCPLLTMLLRWELNCFWSYMDWPNVMIYLDLVGIYGIDYIPLLLAALVKHMRPVIFQATKSKDVLDAQIPVLKWSTYQTWLSHLHNQYHDMIKERMRSL
ncbi:hypothetical protein THRCLA_11827 [Thraustotheca clavata]|uniref:BROMI C-terminal Rab TBC-like domain-containing protein n=1 Tax=Thraustotheca clavata TaxID=74557 RepID=A0A1V9Y6J5_9STRA|nr:hypothetical protein THRCLA_11827 [Thraustotheca clavata]